MDPNTTISPINLPIVPAIQPSPFFKRKSVFICAGVLFSLICLGTFFLLSFPRKKEAPSPISVITPKTWQLEITYSPADGSFLLKKLTIINKAIKKEVGDPSPYTAEVLDKNGKILTSQPISIATNLIIPEVFKNSSAAALLKNTPLTSIIDIPYISGGTTIRIRSKNSLIKDIQLSANVSSMINAMSPISLGFSSQHISSVEGTTPVGWKLSATPSCQNNKAYINYSYTIPRYAGAIFTYDKSSGGPDSTELMKDSSWQHPSLGLVLLSGSGNYIATGNLMNWNPKVDSSLRYNGPVGLVKGNPYEGTLILSGDFTCDINRYNRPGCVSGSPPPPSYWAQTTVTINFTTDSLSQCPAPIPTPTSTLSTQPGVLTPTTTLTGTPNVITPIPDSGNTKATCSPDPTCITGGHTIQICQFICK